MSFLALRIGGQARPGIYKIVLLNHIDSRFRGNDKKMRKFANQSKMGIYQKVTKSKRSGI